MPEPRPDFRNAIFTGLAAAAALAVADAFLWVRAGGVGFIEYGLRPYGALHLPLSGYAFILIVFCGLLTGAAIGLLEHFLIRTPAPWNRTLDAIAALGFLGLLIGVLRVRMGDEIAIFDRYFTGLAAAVVALAVSAAVIRARSGYDPNARDRSPRAALGFIVLLAALVFMAPVIDQVRLPRQKAAGTKPGRPNILLLVLDTMRADALSALNPKAAPTPALDRMAAQGLLFRKALAPASWTVPSHGSLFTGLYLTQHGTTFAHPALDPGLPALAEILAGEGYRTAAFSENPNIARSSGFGRGFGYFAEPFLYGRAALLPALMEKSMARFAGYDPSGEYTADTLGGLVRWIRAGSLKADSPPFFAFVNLMAAHLPDWPRKGVPGPAPDRSLLRRLRPINGAPELNFLPSYALTAPEMEALRGFYTGDVAYLDSRLGDFFRFLESSGILDDTVLVITSDHGENFGEHGLIEHAYCLYNTVLHVPLIMRCPASIPAGSVRAEAVSTIGLFGTLLELAKVPESRRPAGAPRLPLASAPDGGDVFAESENCGGMIRGIIGGEAEAAHFDYRPFDRALSCVYSGDRKLILGSDGRVELYDLSGDWDERNDISAAEPATVERLLGKLAAWRSGLKRPAAAAPEPRLPRGVKDALKSLGYIR